MATSQTLAEILSNGIKTAVGEIGAFFTKPAETTITLNNQVMEPITQKAAEAGKNIFTGTLSAFGLEWPIILLLIGAVAALFLMMKYGRK